MAAAKHTKPILIAPSMLAADFTALGKDLLEAEALGADWHHVDVMDGHFVPNLTIGPPVIAALKKKLTRPMDVHIMVSNPDAVAQDYVRAGADILSFHIEAATHPLRVLQGIRDSGVKAGISINPGTPIEALDPLINYVDLINVMSVNPGFGGQSFIPDAVRRVAAVAALLRRHSRFDEVNIEVDGGINQQTAAMVCEQGANVLVAGTYFYGAKDRQQAIRSLRPSHDQERRHPERGEGSQ